MMLSRRFGLLVFLIALSVACSDDKSEDSSENESPKGECKKATAGDLEQVTFDADGTDGCHWTVKPGSNDQNALQSVLVEAEEGSTVCLSEGKFSFRAEVQVGSAHIAIKGAGKDKTILDFGGQQYGPNAIVNRNDNFYIEGLTILNPTGDGIRVHGAKNIAFVDVAVIWDNQADSTNGAYGLYPVQCENVRIERCLVQGASDAGIYVGQSKNIVVKNNEARGNVAGIEIENSTDAAVYENHSHGNTGGLLIFDLPNHPKKHGQRTRAYNNIIEDNNLENFAPSGVVQQVPAGTGVIILASDNNEVFDNTIRNNSSVGVVTLMYAEGIFGKYKDEEFDAYPEGNYIHDNVLENNGTNPQGIAFILISGKPVPDLSWGGCIAPDKDVQDPKIKNCFVDNGDVKYFNFNLCGEDSLNPDTFDYDRSKVECHHDKLPPLPDCYGLPGCEGAAETPKAKYVAQSACEIPYAKLSDYDFFKGALKNLKPREGVLPYTVASPLWADHAEKGRFIVLPAGKKLTFSADQPFDAPDGTIVIKNFFFDTDRSDGDEGEARLVETRLYIREKDKWVPQVYVWNEEQTDASHVVAGVETEIEFTDKDGKSAKQTYLVPSNIQCGSCHEKNQETQLLGLTARQTNIEVSGDNQLSLLTKQGAFAEMPSTEGYVTFVDPYDSANALDDMARSWLDSNCAHCHREGGGAGSTDLYLSIFQTDETKLGVCKKPIAAGGGAAKLDFDIVPGDPDASILLFRIKSTDPEVKMPELPNLRVDDAGAQLISDWISAMEPVGCD